MKIQVTVTCDELRGLAARAAAAQLGVPETAVDPAEVVFVDVDNDDGETFIDAEARVVLVGVFDTEKAAPPATTPTPT